MTPSQLSLHNHGILSEIAGFMTGYMWHTGKFAKTTIAEIVTQTLADHIPNKILLFETANTIAHVLSNDNHPNTRYWTETAASTLASRNIKLDRPKIKQTLPRILKDLPQEETTKHHTTMSQESDASCLKSMPSASKPKDRKHDKTTTNNRR